MNKYKYCWILQGYYGCGWEDLCSYDTADPEEMKELRADLKSYRENEGVPLRVILRRVLRSAV